MHKFTGKTCQAITFLNWLKHNQKESTTARPHLIVVPASVLSNWFNECARFAPSLNVTMLHGNATERLQRHHQIRDMIQSGSLDIVLVSLTSFQKEKSEDRAFLRKIDFDYLVVDEAHGLSNAKSIRYKSLDKMKTMHRLLLTVSDIFHMNRFAHALSSLGYTRTKLSEGTDVVTLLSNAPLLEKGIQI